MNQPPHCEDLRSRPLRIWRWIYPIFSLLCLAWLLLRSGRKPSRLRYPCQQAAAAHSIWVLGTLGAGFLYVLRSRSRRRLWLIPLLVALVAYLALGVGGGVPVEAVGREVPDLAQARMRAASLTPRYGGAPMPMVITMSSSSVMSPFPSREIPITRGSMPWSVFLARGEHPSTTATPTTRGRPPGALSVPMTWCC